MTIGPFAHGGLAAAAWGHWVWEPVTLLLLGLSAAAYARGVRALWCRAGRGAGIARWQTIAFAAALLTIAAALLSPLAWVSDIVFAAHMTQHQLLMIVAAPLLVIGRPLQAWTWALTADDRVRVAAWTRVPFVAVAWRALTGPGTACALHAIALWVWHVPRLHDAALHDPLVHALQHASFLGTAALFWWGVVHGRYGSIGYGAGVAYVFVTGLHSSLLGALLTLAPSTVYEAYRVAAAPWSVDALADQQAAGLLMWIPSGLVFIGFGLALLAAWIGESERRARLGRLGVHGQEVPAAGSHLREPSRTL